MDKHYDPQSVEAKWYPWWEERGLFHGDPADGGEPYCIVIPPPNVTGILHMGHALNNALQDILARWRRMQGRNVVWLPGTDHAGIATQNVVERALQKEGLSRDALGREAFIERVWAWREEYGSTIVRQLRKLGASCDWKRERFTMDEGLSEAVAEVFCRLYDEGLIYRGNYIVNWCPRCHTALSDEESEHVETDGHMWHIRYPVKGGGEVVVATTRPETMLGDTAVAVNPSDERYAALVGGTVVLPLLGREIPVVADDYVDAAFGTGVVKITPAHDPNDFLVAQRHDLPALNVMESDGRMNAAAGPYEGLDRFEARRKVVADLEALGALVKVDEHAHAVGHCYRCDTVVEPRLSRQWFVRMQPLAEPAIEAVRSGEVKFIPQRWEKTYFEWMENIRDWCISRQIWWGHRIPVYTCGDCRHEWAARTTPAQCPECGKAQITQEEDVLDTWFSSWLWPFSTFGWPHDNADLRYYYPTHDLATAPEIIFFWVARMVMAGQKFMGKIPFRNVYIHGTVRDAQGRKMSKSLGNSIDPLDIIAEYSADALRFSLMMITSTGMDVYVDKNKFEIGRNFGTKIWNAARFMRHYRTAMGAAAGTAAGAEAVDSSSSEAGSAVAEAVGAASGGTVEVMPLEDILNMPGGGATDDDRHLLATLDAARAAVTEALEAFRFQDAARTLYDFLWSTFCDRYIEVVKPDLQSGSEGRSLQVLALMDYVLSAALRLLHPFMPFLTEELWHQMGYGGPEESIMRAEWPRAMTSSEIAAWEIAPETTAFVEAKHGLISAGRALRADYNIAPSARVRFVIQAASADAAARLGRDMLSLKTLLRAEEIEVETGAAELAMPSAMVELGTLYLPLEGLVDIAAEAKRVSDELAKARGFLRGVDAKLNNPGFVGKAPPAVVEQQRERQAELVESIGRLEKLAKTFELAAASSEG